MAVYVSSVDEAPYHGPHQKAAHVAPGDNSDQSVVCLGVGVTGRPCEISCCTEHEVVVVACRWSSKTEPSASGRGSKAYGPFWDLNPGPPRVKRRETPPKRGMLRLHQTDLKGTCHLHYLCRFWRTASVPSLTGSKLDMDSCVHRLGWSA